MEWLAQLEVWHWISLGLFLLLLEILGAGGFLLGMGLAALVLGAVLALIPELTWQLQFAVFAVLSLLLSVLYWRYFRPINEKTEEPLLNNRIASLMGRKVKLLHAIEDGRGKVQIADALWTVSCAIDMPEGTTVEIVGATDMVLAVEPLTDNG